MANTFTSNYSLTKSEIGGDNQNWGQNLHNSLDAVDSQLINKFDKDVVKGFTSTAIVFTNTGTNTGTITVASGDLFEDFEINDKIRVTGATSGTNGSNSSPVIHTITNKSNSNSITVSTGLVTASAGDSVTVTLVFEPGYVDGSAIDNTPIGANTASSGAFTTLSATGATTLDGNITLGNANTDTVTSNAKHGGTTYTGQITSEVSTGNAPFVVASTTSVANLKAANADALSTARTITLSGDCTGSVSFDGSGDVTLTTSVSGKVLFKATINSTSLPSGTAPSSKTWIAFGSGEYNTHATSFGTQTRYGYGYGDCIAIKSDGATSWTEVLPNNVTSVKWSHYIQIDNA